MHVFDADWHGIRNASSFAPGHKFSISHLQEPDGELIRHLLGVIYGADIHHVVFQGYSHSAHALVNILARRRPNRVKLYVVAHVATSQFDNSFEPEMLGLLREAHRDGKIRRLASVKPNFRDVAPFFSEILIYNFIPVLPKHDTESEVDPQTVLVPLENTFRKNLYTNIIAALNSTAVNRIISINQPSFLERLRDISKVEVIGYQRNKRILEWMRSVGCVLNVTYAECQPMTQLEAIACGTACLTGPLNLPVLRELPLTSYTQVAAADDPSYITEKLNTLLELRTNSQDKYAALVREYSDTLTLLARDSYRALLN